MTENPEEHVEVAKPVEEPAPQVDLVAEASQAAATEQQSEGSKIRSLDDLDLDGAVRSQIESYVSKSVNEALSKSDERQKQKLDAEGFMNKSQIEELLANKDAEYTRREEAKDTFLNVLGTEGIAPGSDEYQKIQNYYRGAVDEGKLTPHILLSEAGIKTLVAMSGVGSALPAAPQSGLSRSAPSPDGSVTYADGTLQLNARSDDNQTLDDRARRAVEQALDQTS
tara:strand:- start:1076 stop:1750 length:675 start_codon:yes stop_codon:yes gene_type:complete